MELYKAKKLGAWVVLPMLASLVPFVYAIYNYFTNKTLDWYAIVPLAVIWTAISHASEAESDWEKRLDTKADTSNYLDSYVYTKSRWTHLKYMTAKVIIYLVNILILIGLGIWGYSILGQFEQDRPVQASIWCGVFFLGLLVWRVGQSIEARLDEVDRKLDSMKTALDDLRYGNRHE